MDAIIEGTILRDGNHIRLNVQLVHAPSDRHLWAKHFDRDAANLVSLEDELADAIAREVHVATSLDSARAHAARRHYDPLVEGQYIRGEDALRSRSPGALRQAIALFEQTIARDSTFAPGYAGISVAHGLASELGYIEHAAASEGVNVYVHRALAIDSTLSEAHASLGIAVTRRLPRAHALRSSIPSRCRFASLETAFATTLARRG